MTNISRTARIAAIVLVFVFLLRAERVNQQITITAGTAIRITTVQRTFANRLMIQSRHSNTGIIYVMLGVNPNTVCSASNSAHLSAELGPGDATHPGASLSDPQGAQGNSPPEAEDLSWACIDGTVSSDVALITYYRRN